MWLSEQLLFQLAKRLYRSEVAHSDEMKEALSRNEKYDAYRSAQAARVLDAAKRYGIELEGKAVVDLGCNDGALTVQYGCGAREVIGVDIDEQAIFRARQLHAADNVEYRVSAVDQLPLDDESMDVILCYDVFEHVARPEKLLGECLRVLRPNGKMLIGTWGWYHPFAPHLWATMPVPWAHVVFSERTILRVCRRVYHEPWYCPNMHDLDDSGRKLPDKYTEESISLDYLNKYFVRDFERAFRKSGFEWKVELQPFSSIYARWTKVFLAVPLLRELFTAYLWAVLRKPASVRQTAVVPA